MHKFIHLSVLAITAMLTLAPLSAQEITAEEKPGFVVKSQVASTATVEAIDLDNRLVTLKGPAGNSVTLWVGEEARNLAQVEVGDQVSVLYEETIAIQARASEGAEFSASEGETMTQAAPLGMKPAGTVVKQQTVVAAIVAIDKEAQTVTLKGPSRTLEVIPVQDPDNLDKVDVGDQVVITYTETVSIAVQ